MKVISVASYRDGFPLPHPQEHDHNSNTESELLAAYSTQIAKICSILAGNNNNNALECQIKLGADPSMRQIDISLINGIVTLSINQNNDTATPLSGGKEKEELDGSAAFE